MLNCDVFINADEIARGLSPLNPNKAAIEAGRLLIAKIDRLIVDKTDFAFETILAPRGYTRTIQKARSCGYQITLLFKLYIQSATTGWYSIIPCRHLS